MAIWMTSAQSGHVKPFLRLLHATNYQIIPIRRFLKSRMAELLAQSYNEVPLMLTEENFWVHFAI